MFSFFWKGKPDLVARKVVSQPTSFGGFGVVSIQLKVWALLVQWIRRLVTKPASWVHFFYYYCWHLFGYLPLDVLSRPRSFDLSLLPPFYNSLLVAWQKVDGGFSNRSDTLVMCVSGGLFQGDVSSVSTKLVYSYLLSAAQETPHCVTKFFPRFGPLHWSCTWRQLFFSDVDRQVIDLAWKVSHGILYTASRLVSFGYSVPLACFCGPVCETLVHLFFDCPLAQSALSWIQSLTFRWSRLAPSLENRHVLFGFDSLELRTVPRVFCYLLNVVKYCLWLSRNDFCFHGIPPGAVTVQESVRVRVRFHLPILFKRFTSSRRRRFFVRQWGACNVVASVVDGRLVMRI